MALEGTGTTMAVPDWLTRKNPQERLDNADNVYVQPVNVSRQQIFNPVVMGSTAATAAWLQLVPLSQLQVQQVLKQELI